MTTRKRTNTNKKKPTPKKVRKKENSNKLSADTKMEILIVSIIGASLLWLLANFGLLGRGGNFLSSIFFAIIGLQAYYMPFLLLPVFAFYTINKNNKKRFNNFMLFVLVASISILLELKYIAKSVDLLGMLSRGFENHIGGGILGYVMGFPLKYIFNGLGSTIICITLILICLIIITQKEIMVRTGRKVKNNYSKRLHSPSERKQMMETKKVPKDLKNKQEASNAKSIDKPITQEDFQVNLDAMLKKEEIKQAGAIDLLPQKNSIIHEKTDNTDNTEIKEPKEKVYTKEETKKETKIEKKPKDSSEEKVLKITPITSTTEVESSKYKLPPINLLDSIKSKKADDNSYIRGLAVKLKNTLDSFGVNATIEGISKGPSVTRFEIVPAVGVKVSKIVGLTDDIKLNLAAKDIRIEAPIPGKSAIGIEVPNKDNSMVCLRELVESKEFKASKSKLSFCVGLDIAGKPVISDIKTMPHVLVAGATGSGKSVFINTLIMSIIFKAAPDDVKLIMIDPKVVELSVYNGIPHLLIPVVTNPSKAAGALNWAVAEMEQRYKKFASIGVKDVFGYNNAISQLKDEEKEGHIKLPQIVIIIDELADLMMASSAEVEAAICRLAQLARACGIHLVIATQRPSVNVITGLIKANVPSRIAFSVSSGVDSRTILDMNGAEKLLGKGDMLFHPSSLPKPIRVQGAFVTEDEVSNVVKYISKSSIKDEYKDKVEEVITKETTSSIAKQRTDRDDYFDEAVRIVSTSDKASIGSLQRVLRIGFNRASRIMDQLFDAGIVGAEEGTKARKVLISEDEVESKLKGE